MSLGGRNHMKKYRGPVVKNRTRDVIRAEKALGRGLSSPELVHHHTETQLVICQDGKYHKLLHSRTAAYRKTGDANADIRMSATKSHSRRQNERFPLIMVRVPRSLYRALKAAARRDNRTLADWLRLNLPTLLGDPVALRAIVKSGYSTELVHALENEQ